MDSAQLQFAVSNVSAHAAKSIDAAEEAETPHFCANQDRKSPARFQLEGDHTTVGSNQTGNQRGTISDQLAASGISRRKFMQFCTALLASAPVGLALTDRMSVPALAERIGKAERPSVIWLHMEDCTGCSTSLWSTSHPDLPRLVFNLISLDYHETLMAASGAQAEEALRNAVAKNRGRFILVVEGSVPEENTGAFMKMGGETLNSRLRTIAKDAAAVIAVGSCASWGGVPSADPNPTGASGIRSVLTDKNVICLPGCPPNPYTLLSVILEFATMHKTPALDQLNRPKFAYDRLIHDHCPRRGHFDAGRFAKAFGDEGHRQGWCLYRLGCKGPVTHAPCSTLHFNEIPDVWPIGIGAPCFGCTEQSTGFRIPAYDTVEVHGATPPDQLPGIHVPLGKVGLAAAATVGALAGAAATAGFIANRRLPASMPTPVPPEKPQSSNSSSKGDGQQ